jgi:hypothetical protein
MTASTGKRYRFEGQDLTVSEIRKVVPALSDSTIRKHLAEGRDTRHAMLTYNPLAASRAGGLRGRKASNLSNSIHEDASSRRAVMAERKRANDRKIKALKREALKGKING